MTARKINNPEYSYEFYLICQTTCQNQDSNPCSEVWIWQLSPALKVHCSNHKATETPIKRTLTNFAFQTIEMLQYLPNPQAMCDQRFLSSHLAEINETWHNNNTTPVVDARRTILRFDQKWPPKANLHKWTKSRI